MLAALARAAAEVGCPILGLSSPAPLFAPGVAAHWRLPAFSEANRHNDIERTPPIVCVDLCAPRRKALNEMIDAIVEAGGHEWYRPTAPGSIFGPMRGLWDEIRGRGPQLDGLKERLHADTDTGDGLGEHPVRWFCRTVDAAATAAYFAGAPVNLVGGAVLDSGCGVTIYASVHHQGRKPRPAPGIVEGPTPADTVENAVETVLYGYAMAPGDDGYDTKAAHMRAAMTAASVEVPGTPAACGP